VTDVLTAKLRFFFRRAALALASLLPLHPSALEPLDQILSFCVSVLAEEEQASPRRSVRRAGVGEHAFFNASLAALDPISAQRLPLGPALQQCITRAAAIHGEAFHTALASVDPAILEQARMALSL